MNNFDDAINEMTHGRDGHDTPAAVRVRKIAEDACTLLGDGYSVVSVYQRGYVVHVTLTDGQMARWLGVRVDALRTYADVALPQQLVNDYRVVASGLPMLKGE